jgi:hypothetical protein
LKSFFVVIASFLERVTSAPALGHTAEGTHDDPTGGVDSPLPRSRDPAGVDPSGFGVGAAVGSNFAQIWWGCQRPDFESQASSSKSVLHDTAGTRSGPLLLAAGSARLGLRLVPFTFEQLRGGGEIVDVALGTLCLAS